MRARIAFLALLSIATLGCDAGWEHYDMVELGQPFEGWQDGTTVTDEDGQTAYVWSDAATSIVPTVVAYHVVGVEVDAEGVASARAYHAVAYGNWGVLRTWAFRLVCECAIPASLANAEDADLLKMRLLHLPDTDECRLLSAVPKWKEEELFAAGYIGSFCMDQLTSRVLDSPEELAGLSRADYDRTWSGPGGTSLRIQNLGNGVVRSELRQFSVCDPFLLTWILTTMSAASEEDNSAGDGNGARPDSPDQLTESPSDAQ